jgi:GGDEF domain-containing protein
MTAVFEPTRLEAPERAGSRGLMAQVRALRSHLASGLARLRVMTRREAGTPLLAGKAALMSLGRQRLTEARRDGRPLSLAVFEFSDLEEVRAIYGNRMRRRAMSQVVARLTAAAGSRGAVARTAAAQFTLLLPGSDGLKAHRAIHRAIGMPARVEIESGNHEIVLVPEFRIECARADVDSIEELYLALCRDLADAGRFRHDREQYLTRERERHLRRPSHPWGDANGHGPGADVSPTLPLSLMRD